MNVITVQTPLGAVRGVIEAGTRRWLGVPYAEADRFGPARPPRPWAGTHEAAAFAPQCPQMFGTKARRARHAGPAYGEECLALNIFVPDREPAQADRAAGRPVYVFIHGGAFLAGSANPYDGSWLADLGDIVVVTINYRVGVLGFVNFGDALGLPALPSNNGLRDQIAALEWVRDNIAAFGGDPGRVTIGGQSAGSMSVSLLMLSQRARGLFRGAVLQSGAVSLIHDAETSRAVGRRYAQALGLDQGGLERLRAMDIMTLFGAQGSVQATMRNGIAAAPWFDGDLLPASLDAALAHDAAPVPIIAGATAEETRLFEWLGKGILPMERADTAAIVEAGLPSDQARALLALYLDDKAGNRALASDLSFQMPTRKFAHRHSARHPTYVYRFDYAHPLVGAAHGIDLTIAWPFRSMKMALARGGAFRGRRKALGERMNRHIGHFVRHLEPLPDWPRYLPDERAVRIFDLEDRTIRDPDAERFAAWHTIPACQQPG